MKFFKVCIIATLACFLQSCFNSDEHIFDEANASDIKVKASLARSITDIESNVKADTFHVSDTIYFLTTIIPNKIINVQNYYWLMDGKICSSEYNFKKQITVPGHHKFTFVLKDHFGDEHYDSLDVWIGDTPVLNDTAFIPAEGTQAIDPYETIYFTWKAKTEGINLGHYYHFTLSEQDFANSKSKFIAIDTILSEPHYTYHNKLNPLKKYNWTVQAYNEYNFASAEKIESFFYTKGILGDGSLQATMNIGKASTVPVQLTLQDKSEESKQFHYKFDITSSNNEISLDAIPKGKYQLSLSSDYPDFGTIEKEISINDGFVTILKELKIIDSIAPTIISLDGHDTLDFADTLKFIIKDRGGKITSQKTSVHLESDHIFDKTYRDSVLTVVLKDTDKSWAYRILTISAIDESQNIKTKSFYIAPSIIWFTTNNDTTIAKNEAIRIFINEKNPFGFKIDSLKIINASTNKTLISVAPNSTNNFVTELEGNSFNSEQTIKSIVLYTNGISQSKTWKLYVKEPETKEEE